MSRPRVRLGIPPHLADLELWGRDVAGEWWALVVWSVQVTPPDGTHPVRSAAPRGCPACNWSSRCSRSTISRSGGCNSRRAAATSRGRGRAWGTEQGGAYG